MKLEELINLARIPSIKHPSDHFPPAYIISLQSSIALDQFFITPLEHRTELLNNLKPLLNKLRPQPRIFRISAKKCSYKHKIFLYIFGQVKQLTAQRGRREGEQVKYPS